MPRCGDSVAKRLERWLDWFLEVLAVQILVQILGHAVKS